MGLSDIDEDEPKVATALKPKSTQGPGCVSSYAVSSAVKAALDLEDLFGDMGVATNRSDTSLRPATLTENSHAQLYDSPHSYGAGPPRPSSVPCGGGTGSGHDVLDDLFAAPSTVGNDRSQGPSAELKGEMIYVDGSMASEAISGDNLLDLSSAQRHTYNNEESFLAAFERQCKKGNDRGPFDSSQSLEHITRNKDDNKVKARLLALMNYYDVLGVAPTASEDEIRRHYKRKALELHPDKVSRQQTPEEAELFKVITKAQEILLDPAQRRQYDVELATPKEGPSLGHGSWLNYLQGSS